MSELVLPQYMHYVSHTTQEHTKRNAKGHRSYYFAIDVMLLVLLYYSDC